MHKVSFESGAMKQMKWSNAISSDQKVSETMVRTARSTMGRRLQEGVMMAGPQGKLTALHFFLGLHRLERYVLAFGMWPSLPQYIHCMRINHFLILRLYH